jgi:hypothetical protein
MEIERKTKAMVFPRIETTRKMHASVAFQKKRELQTRMKID